MDTVNANLTSQALQLLQSGDLAQAERVAKDALAAGEDNPDVRFVAGVTAGRRGDQPAALRHLEAALQAKPDFAEAHTAIAGLLRRTQPFLSLEHAQKAAALQPDDADYQFHLGLHYVDVRRFEEAAQCFETAFRLKPENLESLRNLALSQRDAGREMDSVASWEKLVELEPNAIASKLNLAQMYLAHGRFAEAIVLTDKVLKAMPENPMGHLMKALALAEDGRGAEAEPHLLKAIKLNPRDGISHAALGFWYQEQGRFDEARLHLEQSIILNPHHGFAYYNFFRAKKASAEDEPFLDRMQAIAKSRKLHPRDRSYIQYALGKAREDMGLFEAAIYHFDQGNAEAYQVWLAHRPWDRAAYAEGFEKTRKAFTKPAMAAMREGGNDSSLPVMIVGMIRSGTSLLEQILSSHPKIAGAGELPFWQKHEEEVLNEDGSPNVERLSQLAETYLEGLRELAPNAERVTDKLPRNYARLGLIHAALPNAKIIHVRRNPVDNCLSVYTTAYQRPPVFAHSKDNIAFAYREYLKMVAHWRETLPADRFLELDYEMLVAGRERMARKIIEFLELEWSDAVLHHEENQRAVSTASLWQVRQPLYATSVERWKRFEHWIPEFTDLLKG